MNALHGNCRCYILTHTVSLSVSDPVLPAPLGSPREPVLLQLWRLFRVITRIRYQSSWAPVVYCVVNVEHVTHNWCSLPVSTPQGSMVMHMRPPNSGPFPNPIQRPIMQVNKTVIIRSPPYPSPGRELSRSTPPSNPEPALKAPEDGMKVSHPLWT